MGNKYIDEIEMYTQELALKVFKLDKNEWGVNVQPYSGSPANQAVYFALLDAGDTVMGLSLPAGGHLTHGWKVSFSGMYYNSIQYNVMEDGEIDFKELEELTLENKPKLIWAGATAYTRNCNYKKFKDIADKVGAYLACDIAHVAGLIVAGVHNSPFEYADIVTTTTHKTLRGPRGAMIFAKKDLMPGIDKAVFPGLQGGPHNHQTAAIAVALEEALTGDFKKYGQQILINSKALAQALKENKIKLASGGITENHLMLCDFSDFGGGSQVAYALECVDITVNKNTIPHDKYPPYYPSGIRVGTPAITSRGMVESDMKIIAGFIAETVDETKQYILPSIKEERKEFMKRVKKELNNNRKLGEIKCRVNNFAGKFPVPGITV